VAAQETTRLPAWPFVSSVPTSSSGRRAHTSPLSDRAGFAHTRANVWRYEPGAKGRRHRHPIQEETFVVLAGTLSMYLGDPPERVDVPAGGVVHVEAGTPLQTVNHGEEELVLYAYGTPPEREHAEILDPAL
jgi:mannose-6-phosphate isomerase-like protein (cupin superfamily)